MSAPGRETALIARLKLVGACVATVESCTGGQVAARLTGVAGSSEVFWGGWVTYDNSAKVSQLGISPALIAERGAVSVEVAHAMAEGGLAAMVHALGQAAQSSVSGARARICVATTGIAGPGGGSAQKPVGLCFVGMAAQGLPTAVIEVRQPAGQERAHNQRAFADAALAALERLAQALPEKGKP
jgi:nicotinamide-nucleotide amidase